MDDDKIQKLALNNIPTQGNKVHSNNLSKSTNVSKLSCKDSEESVNEMFSNSEGSINKF